ncbi:MAG: hypothetical protein CMH52_01530 [Myxococcales bacterium]|nr:hypothetical protein [Myxococcales bacterium]
MGQAVKYLWIVVAAFSVSFGCSDAPIETSEDQREWLAEYGAQGPFEQVVGSGKEDGAGRPGPSVSWDNDDYQVWPVIQSWNEVSSESGIAWTSDSGLTWDEKYAAWLESMQTTDQPGENGLLTFNLTTPYGKTLLAPVLECAEVAIFLRATFASWYGLPFFLEANDAGERIYLGHFGFRRSNGAPFSGTPRFKSRYQDYSQQWTANGPWPIDRKLRKRGLYGGGDEVPFLGDIDGKAARAGAYFDEIFVNKRVGHFMLLALSWFGSMHLADGANMYHVKADKIRAGDVLLLRWQRRGIGHTVPVMRVTPYDDGRLELAVATGSMPRRYPKWEDGAAAGRYFKKTDAGGAGENVDGDRFAELGGGLRRWRIAEPINGAYRNTFAKTDEADWINSSDLSSIAARISDFEQLLRELSPTEKVSLAEQLINSARSHLQRYPASCAARTRREDAFKQLYDVHADAFGISREETDRQYRKLEDYVFGELIYGSSRTCCWNRSTAAMYDIVMAHAQSTLIDEESGLCQDPLVFKARHVSNTSDGYALYRDYARSIGREAEWVQWSPDEACPQANEFVDDIELQITDVGYCDLSSSSPQTGCQDTGDSHINALELTSGDHDDLKVCAGETDIFSYAGEGNVVIAASLLPGQGELRISVFDASDVLVDTVYSRTEDDGTNFIEPISTYVDDGGALYIEVTGVNPDTVRGYRLSIFQRD